MKKTKKQKAVGIYLCLSLILLTGAVEANSITVLVAVIANFSVASWAYSKVSPIEVEKINDKF